MRCNFQTVYGPKIVFTICQTVGIVRVFFQIVSVCQTVRIVRMCFQTVSDCLYWTWLKKHVPYKRLSKKEVKISSKPWITKEIFAKIKFRDKLYSKLLKGKQPNPNLHYLYKKFRNRVIKDLKDSKSLYFNQYFSLNKRNMQKLWSGIRFILNVGKCKKKSYITSILNNNKPVDNPKYIANIFNNFFANVGKTSEKGIPQGSHSSLFYLRGNYSGSIFLSPVTSHEIWTFIGMTDARSLLAHTVYLLLFWKLLGTIYLSLLHF